MTVLVAVNDAGILHPPTRHIFGQLEGRAGSVHNRLNGIPLFNRIDGWKDETYIGCYACHDEILRPVASTAALNAGSVHALTMPSRFTRAAKASGKISSRSDTNGP